ncbi:mucin-2-like [Penaeus indicus]|uniref:mucin-2-like n=1 Tax=Penaeus indicus TaxID=29960 RepID=UPI00300CE28E
MSTHTTPPKTTHTTSQKNYPHDSPKTTHTRLPKTYPLDSPKTTLSTPLKLPTQLPKNYPHTTSPKLPTRLPQNYPHDSPKTTLSTPPKTIHTTPKNYPHDSPKNYPHDSQKLPTRLPKTTHTTPPKTTLTTPGNLPTRLPKTTHPTPKNYPHDSPKNYPHTTPTDRPAIGIVGGRVFIPTPAPQPPGVNGQLGGGGTCQSISPPDKALCVRPVMQSPREPHRWTLDSITCQTTVYEVGSAVVPDVASTQRDCLRLNLKQPVWIWYSNRSTTFLSAFIHCREGTRKNLSGTFQKRLIALFW